MNSVSEFTKIISKKGTCTMAITTRELARRDFEYLDKEIKSLEKRIKLLPEGKLVVYNVNGHRRCYQAYKEPMTNKKVRRYISNRDRTKLQRMIEKTLCVEELIDKKEEYRGLKMYLNVCKNVESRKDRRIAEVPEIREYTDRLTALPTKYQEWERAEFPTNPFPNEVGIKSVLGVEVRSKSEAYIASRLKAQGLAVRYECELQLDHHKVYPDFTIMDPRTGKIYYWEHLGLMDDESYKEHAMKKLHEYASSGYYPMMNLIITSETKERPLDLGLVDHMIDYFFA